MNRFALSLIALLGVAPLALAQGSDTTPDSPESQYSPPMADGPRGPDDGSLDEGADLIGRGMDMFFRNLMNEMAPEIEGISRDMSDALAIMGPVLSDMALLVDDIGNYQVPERLENGDIIIRRKADAPPPPALGESLRQFRDTPEDRPVPIDPDAPQIEL